MSVAHGKGLRARLERIDALQPRARREEAPQEWAAALGKALVSLGPVPVAFARYLAWRPDVLRLVCCEELGAVPVPVPAPSQAPRRLEHAVEEALDLAAGEVFAHLDPEVVALGSLEQWHHAELASGEPVLVQVPRPDVSGSLEEGLEILGDLCAWLARSGGDAIPWPSLLDDFRDWIDRRRDLSARRRVWKAIEADALLQDAWAWPTIVDELSRGGVVVVEEPAGRFLEEVLREGAGSLEGADLARRLCLAWLELTAFGGASPEGIAGSDVVVLDDDRFLLLGGSPVTVDDEDVQDFFDAVAAAALGHPDAAGRSLLRLADPSPDVDSSARFRARLRQASPVRDGGLGRQFRGVHLAETLFVHWRLLRETGYEARRCLRRLATGVASLQDLASRAAPPNGERDPLSEAVVDLQVMRAAGAVRRALGPLAWRGRLEEALPLLSELPARIDAWLDRRSVPSREASEEETVEARGTALAVILACLAVVVVAASRLHASAPWLEDLAAVLCLVLGGGAIWAAWGRRSTIHRR